MRDLDPNPEANPVGVVATPRNTTIGDLLKSEADWHSREAITAPQGTKIGQFVEHPVLGLPLVALSDETNGKVLVQPGQCTIFMDNILPEDLPEGVTTEELASASMQHGIKYVSTKNTALPTPTLPEGFGA